MSKVWRNYPSLFFLPIILGLILLLCAVCMRMDRGKEQRGMQDDVYGPPASAN